MTRRSSRQPQDRGRVIRFSAFARAHLTRSLFPFLHLSAASNTAIFQAPLQRAHGINERLKPHHSVIATRPFRDLPTITLQFVLQMRLYASTPAHLRIQPRLKQRRCITEAGGRNVWLLQLLLLLMHMLLIRNNRYGQLDRLLSQINIINCAATNHQRSRRAHQRVMIYRDVTGSLPSPIVFCRDILSATAALRFHRWRNKRHGNRGAGIMQGHHDIGQKLIKAE